MESERLERYMDGAECTKDQYNPDDWEVEPYQNRASARSKMAKLICNNICPVREECLEFGLEVGDKHMIYGGLLPSERKNLVSINQNGNQR